MTTKLQELQIELAKTQSEARTWKEAFKMLNYRGVPVNDEVLKKIRSKKTLAENFEEGGKIAQQILLPIKDQFPEKGAIGVQNAFLSGIANLIKNLIVEQIVGALIKLLKDNAVNAFDWLCEQADEQIANGYMKLNDEDKENLKRQLKEHPRFAELLKKIEERENK